MSQEKRGYLRFKMPRKKQTKPKELQIAENFFPVDKDDLKYAVEKLYKKPDFSSLIKIEEPAKKAKKTPKRILDFSLFSSNPFQKNNIANNKKKVIYGPLNKCLLY